MENTEDYPKILIGCPTSYHKEYCLEKYIEGLKNIDYPNFDILLIDNSEDDNYFNKIKSYNIPVIKGPYFESARDRIVSSRNILREKAIENYDYFLNLDQDVIPPKDIIERFLSHKRRVLTGIYFNYKQFTPREKGNSEGTRHGKLFPTIWAPIDNQGNIRQIEEKELNGDLIQVGLCGSGCLFIHKSVLKKIKFRYSKEFDNPKINKLVFDDSYFCHDLRELHIPIYADTSMICKHLIKDKKWIWGNLAKT